MRVEHSNEPACIADHMTEQILACSGQRCFTRKYCWHGTFKNLLCMSERAWSLSRNKAVQMPEHKGTSQLAGAEREYFVSLCMVG